MSSNDSKRIVGMARCERRREVVKIHDVPALASVMPARSGIFLAVNLTCLKAVGSQVCTEVDKDKQKR